MTHSQKLLAATGVTVPAADARALQQGHRVWAVVVSRIAQSSDGQAGSSRVAGPHQAQKRPGRALAVRPAPARGHT